MDCAMLLVSGSHDESLSRHLVHTVTGAVLLFKELLQSFDHTQATARATVWAPMGFNLQQCLATACY